MARMATESQNPLKQLLTTLAPQDHPALGKTPISLAKGPYWARLPPIRPRESSSQSAESQNTNAHATTGAASSSLAIPPIIAPDRIGATRVLLQDTQACVQKFATRMDKLSASVEQGVKDVQLCRTVMEGASEKAVADIADIVYKSQATLSKEVDAQKRLGENTEQSISRVIAANDSLIKLYEAQSASLQSLTQMYQTQQKSLQAVQEQQCQIIRSLAPLEALIKSIPLQFEVNQSNLVGKMLEGMKSGMPQAVEAALGSLDLEPLASRLSAELELKLSHTLNAPPRTGSALNRSSSQALDSGILRETPRKRKRTVGDDRTGESPTKAAKTTEAALETFTSKAATFSTNMEIILAAISDELPHDGLPDLPDSECLDTASTGDQPSTPTPKRRMEPNSLITDVSYSQDEGNDRIPLKELTQTRLNFGAQKPVARRPTILPAKDTTQARAQSMQKSQIPLAVAHLFSSGAASRNGTKSSASSALSSMPTSATSSSTGASKVSTSAASKASKSSSKNKSTPKPSVKRKDKKRLVPPTPVQNQNVNIALERDVVNSKARVKSVTPTNLTVTTSNEVSVASEHDPPNSPKQKRSNADTDAASGGAQLSAHLQDMNKCDPLAPVQPGQEKLRQRKNTDDKGTGIVLVPSSSTPINLLGRADSPDWNMDGAADAMDSAERDLDPLSMIPSSDGFLAVTTDPSSSVLRFTGKQRRTLVLESDSPLGVDLWFDDLF